MRLQRRLALTAGVGPEQHHVAEGAEPLGEPVARRRQRQQPAHALEAVQLRLARAHRLHNPLALGPRLVEAAELLLPGLARARLVAAGGAGVVVGADRLVELALLRLGREEGVRLRLQLLQHPVDPLAAAADGGVEEALAHVAPARQQRLGPLAQADVIEAEERAERRLGRGPAQPLQDRLVEHVARRIEQRVLAPLAPHQLEPGAVLPLEGAAHAQVGHPVGVRVPRLHGDAEEQARDRPQRRALARLVRAVHHLQRVRREVVAPEDELAPREGAERNQAERAQPHASSSSWLPPSRPTTSDSGLAEQPAQRRDVVEPQARIARRLPRAIALAHLGGELAAQIAQLLGELRQLGLVALEAARGGHEPGDGVLADRCARVALGACERHALDPEAVARGVEGDRAQLLGPALAAPEQALVRAR